MVQPSGLKTINGAHSFGQQVEKNERFWFGLLLEGKFCINLFLFSKHCNVKLYYDVIYCASRMKHNCRGGGI
jgi:hypothetical protein